MEIKNILRKKLEAEVLMYERNLKNLDEATFNSILNRWADDSVFYEIDRYNNILRIEPNLKTKKILDIASGCGSFVIQGLLNGYNTYGIEPSDWKQDLIDLKFKKNNYNPEWRKRILKGVGENLPFEDNSFDVINSWQTIEHVQDLKVCVFEMYRVLKPGGKAVLQGPNYFCFHEGHYRMFWFPLLKPNSKFAKFYVGKIRKRPLEGLETFNVVNAYTLRKFCKQAGFKVVNIKKIIIKQALVKHLPITKHKVFMPLHFLTYYLWDFYFWIKKLGMGQRTINFLLIKKL